MTSKEKIKSKPLKNKYTVCKTCLFVKEVPRALVFIKKDMESLLYHDQNTCKECRHQKDGSTIIVIKELVRKVVALRTVKEKERVELLRKNIEARKDFYEEQAKQYCDEGVKVKEYGTRNKITELSYCLDVIDVAFEDVTK